MKSTHLKLRKSNFFLFEKKKDLVAYDLLFLTFLFWTENSFIILASMRKQNTLFKILYKKCVHAGPILDLLDAIIGLNLVPWFLKWIFSSEMVKNNVCLGGASKQNALFQRICPKKHTHPPMYKIGPVMLCV